LLLGGCGSNPPAATPAANATATTPEYRLGAGDELTVFVFGHEDLGGEVTIRPDGRITTPLADDVEAAGRTPSQLAREIETALAEYVRNPKVSVMVRNFVGSFADQIRVVGQAAQPQALPYRANMTVLDVMILVGGLGEFAAGNRAQLVRKVDGKEQSIRVRLDDLLNDGEMSANMPVQPGDVLIIPEARF
jgi:polysaccharide export outer membrane protein